MEVNPVRPRRGLDAPALTTQRDIDDYNLREEDRKDRDQQHSHQLERDRIRNENRRFWASQVFFGGFFTVGVLIAVFNEGDLRSIGAGWAGSILGAFIQREAGTKSADKKDS